MTLYYASENGSLDCVSEKNAKLTENKMVAAFCLMDPLEEPWHWFPCDFGSDGTVQYNELWAGAFRECSEGKKGFIYVLEAEDGDVFPDEEIATICHPEKEIAVKEKIEIPELFGWLMEEEDMGRFRICSFENKSRQHMMLWQNSILRYLAKHRLIDEHECSYAVLIREKLPEIWKKYEKLCGK